jgi:predicted MPP superfamily phosphohydrolase
MIVTRATTSKIVDILYFISSLWLGILTYLFLFNVLNWGIFGIFKGFNLNINLKFLHLIFLGFVFLVTVYGVYNYYNIKDKVVEIKIKNLPESWEKKRVFLISDIHIGSFRDERFISRIVENLNNKNADIIIICGDLFDGTKIDVEKTSEELSKLHANEKVYFVFGNHDTYTKAEDVYKVLNNSNFYILDNASINHDEVDIVGINYSSMHDEKVFAALKESDTLMKPKILLSHEPIRDLKKLEDFGIDLQLSGHTHGGQFFPFNLITKAMYREMNYDLHDFGSFQSFTSSGLGAWGPPFRIFTNSEIVQLKFVKK